MNRGIGSILYPVKDVDAAKALFTRLFGVDPHADAPYYVGFQVEGKEIGLVPNGDQQGLTGPTVYYAVDDIAETIQTLQSGGAQVQQEPRDVGGGRLVALVTDADGNAIGLLQDPS